MKLVELFCGCGGFSLGAHQAGFEVAAAYDVDQVLTSSYQRNFPTTKLLRRDVTALSGDEVLADAGGEVGGIFGGPPCQGFSDIGRRRLDDPRRRLLWHFFRVVSEVEPAFFVMENVRGLAYPNSISVLNDAIEQVAGRYHVFGPVVLDASEFGAATKRGRMFVIGMKIGSARAFEEGDLDVSKRPTPTVRAALSDLIGAVELPGEGEEGEVDRWKIRRPGRPTDYARGLRSPDLIFTSHRKTAHTDNVVRRFAELAPGEIDAVGRHPRLSWDGLCPTLRAGTGSDKGSYQAVRPIHPTDNRVITVREAARLQGFPDSHLFHVTVWHSFRMIGNSVSPIMAKGLFDALRSHIGLCAPARTPAVATEAWTN